LRFLFIFLPLHTPNLFLWLWCKWFPQLLLPIYTLNSCTIPSFNNYSYIVGTVPHFQGWHYEIENKSSCLHEAYLQSSRRETIIREKFY
jgi:hypothetical protein